MVLIVVEALTPSGTLEYGADAFATEAAAEAWLQDNQEWLKHFQCQVSVRFTNS